MTTQIPMMEGCPVASGHLSLYPFQVASIDALLDGFRKGHKRQILCAPTGSGKTEMACHLIMEAMKKDRRVAFVCDRRVLVDQTSQRFSDYGIRHGVAMAQDTFGRFERIQVCSAQTIEKRDYWSDLDILIIDEAHTKRAKILEFAQDWNGPTIGLTATPMTKGLGKIYSNVVNAVTTDYLMSTTNPITKQSYLAPLRIFPATAMDMSDAKVVAGEWAKESVYEASSRIVGDVVGEWVKMTQQLFGGPVKTLLFTASIIDGQNLCRAFQSAGYDFRQTTHRDSNTETTDMIEAFRRGEFMGMASVSKLVKGFDVPDVMCGIDARPNRGSLAEVIQKMGRVMRSSPGKEYGLWLDHAENVLRWYDEIDEFWGDGVSQLDQGKKANANKPATVSRPDAICTGCDFVLPPGAPSCPSCGKQRPKKRSRTEIAPGYISEELTRPGSRNWMKDEPWTWQQISRLALDYKDGDEEAARKSAGGYYKGIYDRWPPFGKPLNPCNGPPDQRVQRRVWANLKAYYARNKR